MRLRRALICTIGLLLAVASTALAQAPVPPASGPGQVCTEIGCQSGVFFTAGVYLASHSSVQRVRVCSLGRCRSTRRGDPPAIAQPLVLALSSERAITVTVTAFDRRGHVVLRRRLVARLRRGQPNGPNCEPVCFQADLTLSRAGVLSAA
jgi:CubicO group peptidase (beta-lactamase class C family)